MKIAIASDDGKTISSHFGRTRGFVIFEIEGKEIKKKEYYYTKGKEKSAAAVLKAAKTPKAKEKPVKKAKKRK